MSPPYSTESLTDYAVDECPICEGMKHVTDLYNGEVVCTVCGCVLNELMIPLTRNGLAFTNEEHYGRRRHGSGMRPSIYDYGLNTLIKGNVDAYGTQLTHEALSEMKRLQRQDNRSKIEESALRNLSVAMAELDRIISELHLTTNVKEESAAIYRRALTEDLVRGRSIDAFVAASIYAACRLLNIPRPLKDVCVASKRTYKEVSMTYRLLITELRMKPPIDDPSKYVPALASVIGIPRPVERDAIDILTRAGKKRALVGKDPRGVAAAALYLASELHGTTIVQRIVAKAADTTEVTLRNRYRSLKKTLKIE